MLTEQLLTTKHSQNDININFHQGDLHVDTEGQENPEHLCISLPCLRSEGLLSSGGCSLRQRPQGHIIYNKV